MSCFISELQIPEDSGGVPWIGCQHCLRRKDCPYVCDQALRFAAHRGRAAAQLLSGEADRFREAVSRADDVRGLLNAGEALERALSCVLRMEISLFQGLGAPMTENRP